MPSLGKVGKVMGIENDAVLYAVVHDHLVFNHVPSFQSSLVPYAVEAIRLAIDEQWESEVEVEGKRLRDNHGKVATAAALVEQFHLDSFVESIKFDTERAN
jgi:hypothetical protein